MDNIRAQFSADLAKAHSAKQVEDVRVRYLGRKGAITTLAKSVNFATMSPDQRKQFGQQLNDLKTFAETRLAQAAETAKSHGAAPGTLPAAKLDLTLPGAEHAVGCHPPDRTGPDGAGRHLPGHGLHGAHRLRSREGILQLRRPEHPRRPPRPRHAGHLLARPTAMLLRTHTSANQVRALERFGAPLRAIFPGRCFRYEATDASHENTFYQLEGLMVDREHLRGQPDRRDEGPPEPDLPPRGRPSACAPASSPSSSRASSWTCQCLLCGGKRLLDLQGTRLDRTDPLRAGPSPRPGVRPHRHLATTAASPSAWA